MQKNLTIKLQHTSTLSISISSLTSNHTKELHLKVPGEVCKMSKNSRQLWPRSKAKFWRKQKIVSKRLVECIKILEVKTTKLPLTLDTSINPPITSQDYLLKKQPAPMQLTRLVRLLERTKAMEESLQQIILNALLSARVHTRKQEWILLQRPGNRIIKQLEAVMW